MTTCANARNQRIKNLNSAEVVPQFWPEEDVSFYSHVTFEPRGSSTRGGGVSVGWVRCVITLVSLAPS